MRHHVVGKHLGRDVGHRNALRRTLLTQFFQHEKITTTRAKAEAIRGEAEHMITQAKRSASDPTRSIHIRRLLNGRLNSKDVVQKIFDEYVPRYAERPGGYTRMYKLGPRKGDAAEMVLLELVDRPVEESETGTVQRVTGSARNLLGRVRRGGRSGQQGQTGQQSDAEKSE
ncbi:MAG: 50S ribosomal protein L17 [Anaerolineae bacterium]|nr:50S ribosomal protein L17 [Anaerolineae bacterium]